MIRCQPSFYIPHGGGPCFFIDDPIGAWTEMAAFLRSMPDRLPRRPDALLLISGHWETRGFVFTGGERPPLIYDYYGFPAHTYALTYDAPGAPVVAQDAAALLRDVGLTAEIDADRGFDHGVFIPLKVALPAADIPIVEMSLDHSLDPALHVAAGRALAPLRDRNVAIIASGMSFHNMAGYRDPAMAAPSEHFDAWLTESVALDGTEREKRLMNWAKAPAARLSHPREEHLLPLMIAAGTSDAPGECIYGGHVVDKRISAYRFD